MIFWELFVSYLKIGFFGFGGGYAMLSLIQNEVVVQHAWMTNARIRRHRGRIADHARPHRYQFGDLRGLHSWNAKRQRRYGILGLGHCDFRGLPAVDDADVPGRPLHRPTQGQSAGKRRHAGTPPGSDRHDWGRPRSC